MSKAVKKGPYAKTISKAFKATCVMRQAVTTEALKEIHATYSRFEIARAENAVLLRFPHKDAAIQRFVEELTELDELICKLSRFI